MAKAVGVGAVVSEVVLAVVLVVVLAVAALTKREGDLVALYGRL